MLTTSIQSVEMRFFLLLLRRRIETSVLSWYLSLGKSKMLNRLELCYYSIRGVHVSIVKNISMCDRDKLMFTIRQFFSRHRSGRAVLIWSLEMKECSSLLVFYLVTNTFWRRSREREWRKKKSSKRFQTLQWSHWNNSSSSFCVYWLIKTLTSMDNRFFLYTLDHLRFLCLSLHISLDSYLWTKRDIVFLFTVHR